jgi:hypothetical protein
MTSASRRTALRALAVTAALPALAGCAGLTMSGGAGPDAAEISVNPTLMVATTRKAGRRGARPTLVRAGARLPDERRAPA